MSVIRLYNGPDGRTHMEELSLASHPELGELQRAESIVFRTYQPGHTMDWHPAPRRQLVITLSGEYEIELEDGSVHRFGAGHVTLAEDVTGKGHMTRVVGDQPRVTATIPLSG